ncbi:MAG: DUF4350 domain-containing protein [Microcella sp.]
MTATIVTPTVGRTVKRSLFWVGVVGVALIVAVLMTALNGSVVGSERWDPNAAAPSGSRAVVTVLGEQGIAVTVATSRSAVDTALADARDAGEAATLLVADGRGILGGDRVAALTGLADRLVLVEPPVAALDALGFPFATTRTVAGPIESGGCALPAATRAGSVDGEALVVYDTEASDACFVAEGGAVVLTETIDGAPVTVLGAGEILENGAIESAGNAALALGLAGEHPRLVWYTPGPADSDAASLAELTPGWVNPIAWLAALTLLAAAFWRGRRLGPVVIENLPVVVKTTETMEGRARLYARGGARLRAIDALRVGTLRRIARSLALGGGAGVDDIITSAAATIGADERTLRELLIDADPRDDAELVRLSDRLTELERAVARRVAQGDDTASTERMNA